MKVIIDRMYDREKTSNSSLELGINDYWDWPLVKQYGFTEFHSVPTYTALAIGPAESEKIDEITGHLKLL